jgi:hypothetical protein
VLEQARRVAQQIMESDPTLEAHAGLAAALAEQRQRTAAPARLN